VSGQAGQKHDRCICHACNKVCGSQWKNTDDDRCMTDRKISLNDLFFWFKWANL
jgi:hypothetical protein